MGSGPRKNIAAAMCNTEQHFLAHFPLPYQGMSEKEARERRNNASKGRRQELDPLKPESPEEFQTCMDKLFLVSSSPFPLLNSNQQQ